MKFSTCFAIRLILLVALGSAQFLFAQGTDLGTIRGLVTDSSGAVIPNARVTILDLGTNTPHQTKTNAVGEYLLFGLSSGSYKVSVSAPGMATVQITGIVLNGSDTATADAVLRVESSNQAVEVTEEAPLINVENQTISDTITSRGVIDLPRESRRVQRMASSSSWARRVTAPAFRSMASAQTAEFSASRPAASPRWKR